jgi:FkbM family methyltransferase
MQSILPASSGPAVVATRRSGRIPHPSLATFPSVLAWLATRPSFCVVQIGANSGDTPEDPLYRFLRNELCELTPERRDRTLVVLVEPVREYFDRLQEAYSGLPCVRFENVAIAETRGLREFYRLDADPATHGYPAWLAGLGSLRADRMTSLWEHYEKGHGGETYEEMKRFYEEHRVIEPVRCITLQDLVGRHSIEAIDLLQIDAEGYDHRILQTIDFERMRPSFINYERVLLQDEEAACRHLMIQAGYGLSDWGQDTLCVRLR